FVHGGDLWRLNTPLSCLQPPQQGKTHLYTVLFKIFFNLQAKFWRFFSGLFCLKTWSVIHRNGA
ncbi:hypothetical protein, partial [Citrobacter amalonaticus]|uniref:hypothetical protein n=1 Tax=Citrobacter amalonaticus TaxID=35703 RepID=UPI001C531E5C